jgi:hypothetical protein
VSRSSASPSLAGSFGGSRHGTGFKVDTSGTETTLHWFEGGAGERMPVELGDFVNLTWRFATKPAATGLRLPPGLQHRPA